MKPHAVASLLFLVVLASSALFISALRPAVAQTSSAVFIQADGTVVGTNSLQRNGDVYTFVGNFSGPLTVERDNIVIDGAGYTLVGGVGRGIVLAQRTNVTVENAYLTLDGGYIIDFTNATDCSLIGNTLVGTPQSTASHTSPSSRRNADACRWGLMQ